MNNYPSEFKLQKSKVLRMRCIFSTPSYTGQLDAILTVAFKPAFYMMDNADIDVAKSGPFGDGT